MRHRMNSLGVVAAVVIAAALLALGFGMQRRSSPTGGDLASTGVSIGSGGSPAVTRRSDGRSPSAVGESSRDAAGGASQSVGIEPTLPAVVLDRNTEYVVEDGMIVPQRLVGPGMASGGIGGEPAVPEASPMDVATAGSEQLTVPSGVARPVIDVPDQQVPGGQDAVTRTGTAEASPLQVPGN